MQLNTLLPAPRALTWEEVSITPERITIFVRSALPSGVCPQCGILPPDIVVTDGEQRKQQRRAWRLKRYRRVVKLHAQGLSTREIARQMGMHLRTVRQRSMRRLLSGQ